MTRRNGTQSTLLLADDWSTVWRCRCGYDSAGRERCLMCGSRAPAEAQETPGLKADQDRGPGSTTPSRKASGKATRTVVKIIGANVLMSIGLFAYFVANDTPTTKAVRIELVAGLLYYSLCAAWVHLRSVDLGLRAQWGRATARLGAMEGFIVGAAASVFVVGLLYAIFGRPMLDPSAGMIATSSIPGVILGVLLIAVAAPLVEELVFRGFLLEAFRGKGKWAAVMLSAVAFSLAHLNFAQFRYYVAMGVMFALVYWRRGLVGSIAAHATFNGMLIVFAVAATYGPTVDVEFGGSHVAVPGTYQSEEWVMGDDLFVTGPGGQTVEFAHVQMPDAPPAEELAALVVRGGLPLPPDLVAIDPTSVSLVDLPAGKAVSVVAGVLGEQGRVVMLPTEGQLWFVVFRSDGTFRSTQDFDAMLASWRPAPSVALP